MAGCPGEFLWGTAISAHVVEGGNYNSDWWRWEQRPGRVRDSAKVAADHFNRYREDIRLARKLGQRALLFNLEWSRIEPEHGRFDEDAIKHYADVFAALRAEGLEPVCALQHVTIPQWFADAGGWAGTNAAQTFTNYAQRAAAEFGGMCRWWIPILEPMHTVEMAYIEGLWPPGKTGAVVAAGSFGNIVQAHALAWRALHDVRPDAMVGASTRARRFQPLNEHSAWDYRAAMAETSRCNHWFFDAVTAGEWPRIPARAPRDVAGTADFLAFSYYGAEWTKFSLLRPGRIFAQPVDELGAPSKTPRPRPCPQGLKDVIESYRNYKLPLMIAGNGMPADDDVERQRFLVDHVSVVLECIRNGGQLRGYFWYSLLDGTEWTEGYAQRYGLIHVDPSSQARTPNASAYVYKDICETGAVRRAATDDREAQA